MYAYRYLLFVNLPLLSHFDMGNLDLLITNNSFTLFRATISTGFLSISTGFLSISTFFLATFFGDLKPKNKAAFISRVSSIVSLVIYVLYR